jgi:hypothetical protein
MKKILVIGHSHLGALKSGKTADNTFEFHSIIEKGINTLSELDTDNYNSIVLTIVGNHHNILGLVNDPEPFDFFLPQEIDVPLKNDARLLPVNLITKVFERQLKNAFDLTQTLRNIFKNNMMYHVESPPPIPSEQYIIAHPGTTGVFKEKIEQLGVSPVYFRYKLWRLHSQIIRENCQKLNIEFINTPKESQDKTGCLIEKYWHVDPTHANAFYGDLVLNQIRAIHNINTK